MSQLQATIAMLEKLGTPEATAEANRLKTLDENFIPQSEFNKRNEKLQAALKALKDDLLQDITDQPTRDLVEKLPDYESIVEFKKRFIADKVVAKGKVEDLTKLLTQRDTEINQRDTELAKTKKELEDEKKIADQHRAYHKSIVDQIKKNMGDKWLPEYETFSLESLGKIAGEGTLLLNVIGTAGRPLQATPLEQQLEKAQKEGKTLEAVTLKRLIAEEQQKKK